MSKTENTRIRYGRVNDHSPKNTLVTVRDGDTVYFGISRCNMDAGDRFNKDTGKMIASRRAALAASESDRYNYLSGTNVQVHDSGLRGRVPRESIVDLLRTFGSIDRVLYDRAVASRTNNSEHVEV